MSKLPIRGLAGAIAVAASLPAPAAEAPAAPVADAAPIQEIEITATRQRLDAARNGLSPDTGSTVYRIDAQDLAKIPLGDSAPLNEVLLRAPGIVQDSFGQLHVRGDHANVQYRINGVLIPESISGFGQTLQTRLADRIDILTGALPAQYGYRTAAVVDLQTRSIDVGSGGSVGVIGGSYGHAEADADVAGTRGRFSYFLTGSLLRNELGIENPTPARDAIHDLTQQGKGFGYLSYLLGNDSRVSTLFGVTDNRFEIPNVPGQTPVYQLDGVTDVDSAKLDARQRERNRFVVVSLQGSLGGDTDYQASLFHRLTDITYTPDPVGDLVFNGVAADLLRRNIADGVQADFSRPLGAAHTLRAGLFAQRESYRVDNSSQVFPADDDGNQTSTTPITVVDNTLIHGHTWGAYLQDEWRPAAALTINYGLRYDQVHTVVDEQQWSPRFGLVFDATRDLRLHAGYARYFTPPPTEKIDTTSVQKFLGTTNALPSDANTAVRSERSDYLDAGLAWAASPGLTLGVDGYYRRVRHLQDEGQFGNALVFSAFNYEQGRIYGLEFTGTYRGGPWSGFGNLAWSRAMGRNIETGQFNFDPDELAYIASNWVHLDHDQQLTASGGASYRWPDGWALGADALFGSGLRRGFANTEHLPSYTQVNMTATRSVDLGAGAGKVDLKVAVLNLFDRVYQLRDGSGIGVGAPQYGIRRALYLGATKSF